jgi:hypothetical protein
MGASMLQRKLAHLLEKSMNTEFEFIFMKKYSQNNVGMYSRYLSVSSHKKDVNKKSLIPRFGVTLLINKNKLQRTHLECTKFNNTFITNITENAKMELKNNKCGEFI